MKNPILIVALTVLWHSQTFGQGFDSESCITPIRTFSQYEKGSSTFEETLNNASTTYGMSQALAQLNDYWDGVLNEVYQDLIHTLECRASDYEEFLEGSDDINPSLKMIEVLRSGQRAWIQVRDADAEFGYYEFFGGTMAPLNKTGIVMSKTKDRAKELLEINNNFKAPSEY